MAQSPIEPGSSIQVYLSDENDPEEGSLEAYFYPPDDSGGFMIAGSFGTEDANFAWAIRGLAQFHSLPVVDNTPNKRMS